MKSLPDEYQPIVLRPHRPRRTDGGPVYAIGIRHRSVEYGMIAGPTSDVKEMLDIVPSQKRAYIIRFHGDEQEPIYRWEFDRWKRIQRKD